ncbi:MAG: hypothetical protein NTZ03_07210 [Actinobacteria bacterium]|nr:hypothetical protein [Actinomycetota bacterium]
MSGQLLALALMLPRDGDLATYEHQARLASRLGYSAIHIPNSRDAQLSEAEVTQLIRAAEPMSVITDDDDNDDDATIVRRNDPDLVRSTRAMLTALGDERPVTVAVSLSIGRTRSEAMARADRDPRLVGAAHPQESGIFGTFEQAQQQVLELARAGAQILLVTVPQELDIADVLAQVRALVVGATPALFNDEN